jgi:hypothetical protein
VNISRTTRFEKISPAAFIGIFAEKSVGTGSAKNLSELVLAASVLSVKLTNCPVNEKN